LKLTKDAAQALTNLRGNPDFDKVLKWLAETREQCRDKLEKTEGPQLHREQGRSTLISEFFSAVREAPTTTDKLKQQER
jgi:hypothetical protein